MKVGDKQIKEFANTIYPFINEYLNNNMKAYNKFLQKEYSHNKICNIKEVN